ncbi:TlpA family protein disulfide reductase [Flagellimonas onchidii]|uniref:TlpA family protein disulfide reductase n=1 Tax=Flagellimonas onchidii TaxID=2562684 RepID=UPI0010A689E1|nr:transaldolase [Allomuricauda onchidii]
MIRLLLGLSLLSILACSTKSKECQTVFFGGEIVNPTSDYVVLYKNDSYIDSVKLDKGNRFAFNLQGIDEGLYHFDHSPELQYLYLQEGDSILIRLNTKEFDESLVFSGQGSEINNFLIEMFLAHEDEKPLIYEYYGLKPNEFVMKMDSLKAVKTNHLIDLSTDNQLSEKVISVAKASIEYEDLIHREKYPFKHKWKKGANKIPELSNSFYEYRKSIDFNDANLTYFKPYIDFLKYHFGNVAYETCMKNCTAQEKPTFDYLHFNRHTLKLVDSIVQENDLRDILFRNIAMEYLLKEHTPSKQCESFIRKFQSLSTNDKHEEEILQLYGNIKKLQSKNNLPELFVTNSDGQKISLKDISRKKNAVFYFWSAVQKSDIKHTVKRVSKLQKKYPDHKFVGIGLKTSSKQWMELIEEYGMQKENQFYAENFKEIQTKLVIDNRYKCIISKDTLVVDAFANLYTSL